MSARHDRRDLARSSDPETSHEAADALALNELEAATWRCLLDAGPAGLTTSEIAERTGFERDSISPRMPRLVKAGFAADSGERRIPPGRKRRAIVWRGREPRPTAATQGVFFDNSPTAGSRRMEPEP